MCKALQFTPKWKEELVCEMDGKKFILELTMGNLTAFLPTKSKWEASAPAWATNQWERVHHNLQSWCMKQNIPLVVEDHAWVEFK